MKMTQIRASYTPKRLYFFKNRLEFTFFNPILAQNPAQLPRETCRWNGWMDERQPQNPKWAPQYLSRKGREILLSYPMDFTQNRNENQKKWEKSRNKKAPNLRKLTKRKTEIWSFFDQEENNQEEEKKHQWRMKKTSSLINSPAEVFGLSIPFDLASTSLNLLMICITFTPL